MDTPLRLVKPDQSVFSFSGYLSKSRRVSMTHLNSSFPTGLVNPTPRTPSKKTCTKFVCPFPPTPFLSNAKSSPCDSGKAFHNANSNVFSDDCSNDGFPPEERSSGPQYHHHHVVVASVDQQHSPRPLRSHKVSPSLCKNAVSQDAFLLERKQQQPPSSLVSPSKLSKRQKHTLLSSSPVSFDNATTSRYNNNYTSTSPLFRKTSSEFMKKLNKTKAFEFSQNGYYNDNSHSYETSMPITPYTSSPIEDLNTLATLGSSSNSSTTASKTSPSTTDSPSHLFSSASEDHQTSERGYETCYGFGSFRDSNPFNKSENDVDEQEEDDDEILHSQQHIKNELSLHDQTKFESEHEEDFYKNGHFQDKFSDLDSPFISSEVDRISSPFFIKKTTSKSFHLSSNAEDLDDVFDDSKEESPFTHCTHPSKNNGWWAGLPHILDQDYFNSSVNSDYSEYFEIVDVIGSGSFAEVYKVVSRLNSETYAIKRTKRAFTGMNDRNRQLEEPHAMWTIEPHPHCLRIINSWEQQGHLYIQTQYCEGGSLHSLIEKTVYEGGMFDESLAWNILLHISMGIKHIHQYGFVHLDIKPENIVIDHKGFLKIGDFGLTKVLGDKQDIDMEGDKVYMAPEVLEGNFLKASDIFSIGLVILELAANIELPTQGDSWQTLRCGKFDYINFQQEISSSLKDLIFSMLHPEPAQRPDIDSIIEISYAHVGNIHGIYEH